MVLEGVIDREFNNFVDDFEKIQLSRRSQKRREARCNTVRLQCQGNSARGHDAGGFMQAPTERQGKTSKTRRKNGFHIRKEQSRTRRRKGSKRKSGEGIRISMARARSSLDLELLEARMMIGAPCNGSLAHYYWLIAWVRFAPPPEIDARVDEGRMRGRGVGGCRVACTTESHSAATILCLMQVACRQRVQQK